MRPHARGCQAAVLGTQACASLTSPLGAAAKNLKPATMELGGKSPMIVFPDADIDKAVEWVASALFGQHAVWLWADMHLQAKTL